MEVESNWQTPSYAANIHCIKQNNNACHIYFIQYQIYTYIWKEIIDIRK